VIAVKWLHDGSARRSAFRFVIARMSLAVAIILVAPAIVGDGGKGPMVRGPPARAGSQGADLTPNCVVRDADDQVTSPLIEAEIFIVRQNYRRIGEHFDQQPDTAVLLDQPVPRR
jgi:hypothetical protein